MKMFEDKIFSGPLAEFLENCKPHRVEAIYNAEYRYIKEIIYDTEKEYKYGTTRKGYERFKATEPGSISFGGEVSLRTRTNKDKQIIGYVTESERTNNDNFNHMLEQYNLAKAKLMEILEVKDVENFEYWLNSYAPFRVSKRMGANETISAIEKLDKILSNYGDDFEFKKFLDKIK